MSLTVHRDLKREYARLHGWWSERTALRILGEVS